MSHNCRFWNKRPNNVMIWPVEVLLKKKNILVEQQDIRLRKRYNLFFMTVSLVRPESNMMDEELPATLNIFAMMNRK